MAQFTSETTEKGVTERRFALDRPGDAVPGVLWTPEAADGTDDGDRGRPLVVIGHGGSQHKRAPNVLALARCLVRHHGFAALAIDAPFHGERMPPSERELPFDEQRRALRRRLFGGDQEGIAARAVADTTAALDFARSLPEVGTGP
ncbi:MAG TPA: hypothetical protein VFI47_15045, partial [Acidimicrobiales bacterium]|nr:hypothetical protein [Acidimicrobiales bacterium]